MSDIGHRTVLALTDADLRRWRASHRRGEAASALPYGLEQLEQRGHRVIGPRLATRGPANKAFDVWSHRSGVPMEPAARGLPRALSADVVLCALEQHARAAGTLARMPLSPYRRRPVVALTCWLAEELRHLRPSDRRELVAAYAAVDRFVFWSSNQREIYLDAGIGPGRLIDVQYGVDVDFYTGDPAAARSIPFLTVGQDRGRDYATLWRAIEGSELTVDVVCPPPRLGKGVPTSNVTLHGAVPHRRYSQLLREARTVVVPTHELAYPTGQSVALEAAASGACVVVAATVAMREYFEDGVTAFLYAPGDPDSLRAAMRRAVRSQERADVADRAQRAARERWSTSRMWADIAEGLSGTGIAI